MRAIRYERSLYVLTFVFFCSGGIHIVLQHIFDQVLGTVTGAGSAVAGWALHTAGLFGEDKNNKNKSTASPKGESNDSECQRNQMKLHMQQRNLVKTFLKRARAAYGRTALCLSGGAMMVSIVFPFLNQL